MSCDQVIGDLVKIKMLAVNQSGARWAMSQDLIVNVGARVDTDRARLDQPYGPDRQQICRPRPGPDEMNRHSRSLTALHCTTARAGRQP